MNDDQPLPSADEVLSAVRCGRVTDSPLLAWAAELAGLYGELAASLPQQQEIRVRIRAVVTAIDTWLAGQLPTNRCGPTKGTESFGSVVSRLAEAHVLACRELARLPAADERVHRAWVQLAELRDGYDDLLPQALSRRVDLPRTWCGSTTPVPRKGHRTTSNASQMITDAPADERRHADQC
ncbi:hypothetical protein [Nocardia cyriacigeorgica]|uniref:hypothetical protein n=1 Tax=Nocardia cyriacigeorgica TaxID=135487 RepID=UPI0006621E71|nr:hypothetical protein [Nocardia cyriacigeorgica]BDT89652.1 hypothetical protein FMUAM8_54160 [Nocardia cyriacigeorgica]